jgi:hypothetical protein
LVQTDSVEQVVTDLRRDLLAGKTLRSHVRITVRLTNGNKLRGIVKDTKLVQTDGGLRFAPSEPKDRTDGIKLWYSEGRSSYVVLPFADIRDYLVQERLTSEQLRAIELQVAAAEKAAVVDKSAAQQSAAEQPAEGQAAGEAVPAKPTEGGEPTPGQSEGRPPATGVATKPGDAASGLQSASGASGAADEQKRMFALVQEFPPSAGWSAKKRDEIASRMAVIGAKPSKAEQRFCEVFTDWQKACTTFGVDPTPPPAETGAEQPADRRRKKRE